MRRALLWLAAVTILIISLYFVTAYPMFNPNGEINGKSIYGITNFTYLNVTKNVTAPIFCLGTDCITSWLNSAFYINVTNLQSSNSSTNTRVDTINSSYLAADSALTTRVNTVNTTVQNLLSSNTSINTRVDTVNTTAQNLISSNASINTRVDTVNTTTQNLVSSNTSIYQGLASINTTAVAKASPGNCVGANSTHVNVTMNTTTGGVQCVAVALNPGTSGSGGGNTTGSGIASYLSRWLNSTTIEASGLVDNSTGLYYNTSKVSVRNSEIVVCRGLNTTDDLLKQKTCDYVCLSTDTDCAAEIQSATNVSNKKVFIQHSTLIYDTSSQPIDVKSNVTIESDGAILFANATNTSTWGSPAGHRGIFLITNESNVEIRGINFQIHGTAVGIASFGHDTLFIEKNSFTGTSTAFGGAIFFDGGEGVVSFTNSHIVNNRFFNINDTESIHIYPRYGNIVRDVFIEQNYFNRTHINNVKLASYDFLEHVEINNNHMYDITSDSSVGDLNQYGAIHQYFGGGCYFTRDVRVVGNTFEQNIYNESIGFAFFYCMNDLKITGNTIVASNGTFNQSGNVNVAAPITAGNPNALAPAIAIGRTTTPIYNVEIASNYVNGFDGFIDFDSSVNVNVHDNLVENCDDEVLEVGYGSVKSSIRVHDNVAINCVDPVYPCAISASSGSPLNSIIENNDIFFNRTDTTLNWSLCYIGTNQNYSSLTVRNNNIYNSTYINSTPKRWVGSEIPPGTNKVYGNKEVDDNNFSIGGTDFFVDTSNNKIGVGTANPNNTLSVVGDGNFTGNLYDNTNRVCTAANGLCVSSSGGGNVTATSSTYRINVTPLYDWSGLGNTLTNNGATYNDTNSWYEFDGTNDYLTAPASATMMPNGGNNFTVAAWIRYNTGSSSSRMIVNKGTASAGKIFILRVQPANTVLFSFSGEDLTNTGPGLTSNTWYHVVATFNGSNQSMYINGVYNTSRTNTSTINVTNSTLFYIGGRGGASEFWNGSLDDVRVFNRVLDSTEITTIYNNGSVASDVVGWYPFTNFTRPAGFLPLFTNLTNIEASNLYDNGSALVTNVSLYINGNLALTSLDNSTTHARISTLNTTLLTKVSASNGTANYPCLFTNSTNCEAAYLNVSYTTQWPVAPLSANTFSNAYFVNASGIYNNVSTVNLTGGSGITVTTAANGSITINTSGSLTAQKIYGSGTPTITADTGAGTGPTVALDTGSNDLFGTLNITTGITPAGSNAIVVNVTFSSAWATRPFCNVRAADADSAGLGVTSMVFVDASTTNVTRFSLKGGTVGLTGSTAYQWTYSCGG